MTNKGQLLQDPFLNTLRRERVPVSAGAIRQGLADVRLPGRFQVLPGTPRIGRCVSGTSSR